MNSKIRLKMGPIEVEYEGSENFLRKELPHFLIAVSKLYKESGISEKGSADPASGAGAGASNSTAILEMTTGAIAAKLSCKSGPELVTAAGARLTFVSGRPSFSRKELADEMKSASGYYKKTYLSNLSQYLLGLVKDGKLTEPAAGRYCLGAEIKKELERGFAK